MSAHEVAVVIDPARFDAVVFDMDGVVTKTTVAHRGAWKRLFDEYLAEAKGPDEPPFDDRSDYLEYVDGKPRYDGVRSFLASRGIILPEGDPSDAPDQETVCGLGNRKNVHFRAHVRDVGVEPYTTTLEFIASLRAADVRVGLITSSRNASMVLEAAGVQHLFEVIIDGNVAAERGLPGKPDPAVFVEATHALGAEPAAAVVVEDALSGVAAGRAGGFGLVIGVARDDNVDELAAGGADVVVLDLEAVTVG
ncbi:MAG: beta-phosphoglucomutase family hydrolase [Acidimicrobiia bacterium]|nr:beta-phosphoglucomutase family hydrolase [Acidimicrobiia bacterium]